MTDIITGLPHSLGAKAARMPGSAEHDWRYYDQMPMLTSQWGDQGPQMGGMHDVDLRMFQHEPADPFESYGRGTGQIMSPGTGLPADAQWHSDVDMGTPTTAGFPIEISEGYRAAHANTNVHLHLPKYDGHGMPGGSRPSSAQDGASSKEAPQHAQATRADQRPAFGRSITAPEPRVRRSTTSNLEPPTLKRGGTTSEDGDDDFVPCEDTKNRGRKRQRIPHTAVERRYRENLNAHLDKLRMTVPALAARGGKGGEAAHEGVKPSKCEILNGAIEHIIAADKETLALKEEVKMLRGELKKWYRNPRGSAFGA